MLDNKQLIVLGYSGHAYVVIDSAASSGINTLAYCDLVESKSNPYHIKYLGQESELTDQDITSSNYFFAAVGDNSIRRKLAKFIENKHWHEINIIHKTAILSEEISLSSLILIGPNAVINSQSKIGRACIINSAAIVEHESVIGDYTHIGPGAIVLGAVKIGHSCLIGAGSTILPGVEIGDDVTIGAGSVVVKNVPSGETWFGNPARKFNK